MLNAFGNRERDVRLANGRVNRMLGMLGLLLFEDIPMMVINLMIIHDEMQIEVIGSRDEAEHLGKIVASTMLETGENLGFMIPTPGDYQIGQTWLDTH